MTAGRSYKTAAIVLRGRTYGEADRILTLFSSERGKIDAIAKGSRRTKSHLAGRLELGNEVALTMHRGRNLDVVVSAEIEEAHWQRLVSPERYAAANLVVELVDAFCEPDLAMPEIYRLLAGVLRAIGNNDDPLGVIPRFSLLLLGALGLAPPVDACIVCGAPLGAKGAWLDPEQGGFAGDECRAAWRDLQALDERDMANIRALASPRGSGSAGLRATPAAARAVETLVNHHLGRRPRSGAHAAELAKK